MNYSVQRSDMLHNNQIRDHINYELVHLIFKRIKLPSLQKCQLMFFRRSNTNGILNNGSVTSKI